MEFERIQKVGDYEEIKRVKVSVEEMRAMGGTFVERMLNQLDPPESPIINARLEAPTNYLPPQHSQYPQHSQPQLPPWYGQQQPQLPPQTQTYFDPVTGQQTVIQSQVTQPAPILETPIQQSYSQSYDLPVTEKVPTQRPVQKNPFDKAEDFIQSLVRKLPKLSGGLLIEAAIIIILMTLVVRSPVFWPTVSGIFTGNTVQGVPSPEERRRDLQRYNQQRQQPRQQVPQFQQPPQQ